MLSEEIGRKEMFYLIYKDSERGNLLAPNRLLFPISSKGSMHHHTAFVTHIGVKHITD